MSTGLGCASFHFCTSSLLIEITGKSAHHLKEFVRILKEIDESSIFFHVHNAFREYSFAPGQYSNDFARWVAEDLKESTLAEKLSSVYALDFTDLNAIRDRFVEIMEDHLSTAVEIRKASPGREFHFLRSIAIVSKTPYQAKDLEEFSTMLKRVGMRSLYFHFFDARLRLGHKTNDFSIWIRNCLQNEKVADEIDALDPYLMTMDQLRDRIVDICQGRINNKLFSMIIRIPCEIAHDIFTFGKRIYRLLFRWINE
ncbi:MAG: DUF5752 family protein [Candidatus Margulisiibacteriota bacterium]|nr:DUF5752 family protein [Candidatus Margulisiibacteriota bacterium]